MFPVAEDNGTFNRERVAAVRERTCVMEMMGKTAAVDQPHVFQEPSDGQGHRSQRSHEQVVQDSVVTTLW